MCECEYTCIHVCICSHTHTHTYNTHMHMGLTLIFIAIQGVWHLHVLTQHAGLQIQVVVTINGWGMYNNQRSNTSKGWGFPTKVPPPPPPPSHTSYWINRPCGLDSAVTAFRAVTLGAAWNVGMACNAFKLLWPHPPDVQACTSMYAVNSCSPYTVYGIGQGRDLPLPPPGLPLI